MDQYYYDTIKLGKHTTYKEGKLTKRDIHKIARIIQLWHNSKYSEYININGLEFWAIHLAVDWINNGEYHNRTIDFYIDIVKRELKRLLK